MHRISSVALLALAAALMLASTQLAAQGDPSWRRRLWPLARRAPWVPEPYTQSLLAPCHRHTCTVLC
jgi:hypothetical protein